MVLMVMYFRGFITSLETGHRESVLEGHILQWRTTHEVFWAQFCLC